MEALIDKVLSEVEGFRYERKFVVPELSLDELELILKLHPAAFREIYQQRFVNNIYFDTFDAGSYWDNIDGNGKRLKFRVRWYGELEGSIKDAFLELKIKDGLCGYKLRYPLAPFTLDMNAGMPDPREIFARSALPEYIRFILNSFAVTLVNRYARKYYLSFSRSFRVTLDTGITYYDSILRPVMLDDKILELKYTDEAADDASLISGGFPFRVRRHSKYVCGLQILNGQRCFN